MKLRHRLMVLILAFAMLVTGSGIVSFAETMGDDISSVDMFAESVSKDAEAASAEDQEEAEDEEDQEAAEDEDTDSAEDEDADSAEAEDNAAEEDAQDAEDASDEEAAEESGSQDEDSADSNSDENAEAAEPSDTVEDAEAADGVEEIPADEEADTEEIKLVHRIIEAEILDPEEAEEGKTSGSGESADDAGKKSDKKDKKSDKKDSKYDKDAVITIEGEMPEDAYATAMPVDVEIEGQKVLTAYDITIYTMEEDEAVVWQPETPLNVSISDNKIEKKDDKAELSVYHMENEDAEPELVAETQADDGKVEFEAESFSVYVIVEVEGTEYEPAGEHKATTLDKVAELGEAGFYISNTGLFLSGGIVNNVTNDRKGLEANVSPPQNKPIPDGAGLFKFILKEGTNNQFYIQNVVQNNKYIKLTSVPTNPLRAGLEHVDDQSDATAFTLAKTGDDMFFISAKIGDKEYWWNKNTKSPGSGAIVAYNSKSDANAVKAQLWYKTESEDDPYKLNGKSYGILNYNNGTSAYAMMDESNGNALMRLSVLIRKDPMDQSKNLFVAKDSDIPFFTIENISEDRYYLITDGKYLRIDGSTVSLTESQDDYCVMRIVPGTGSRKGKIRIVGVESGKGLQMTGNGFEAATVNANNNNQWHNFADHSVYDESDFVRYKAYKVGASDSVNVADGKQVVMYIRLWNNTTSQYEFFAVDHNGDLVPVYESGDTIVWIGAKINTLLWDFTEYFKPGSTVANDYYDLKNAYSEKYLAPQISGNQVFSDEPWGVNLTGRAYSQFFTPILAWDDSHYDYAGLKAENGKVVPCPMSESEDFYFAVMKLGEEDLHEVATVDHEALGMTVKMVDFRDEAQQNAVLGSSDGGMGTTLKQGLLSTNIPEGSNYPDTTKESGGSLAELFDVEGSIQVNHLFIKSVYDGSGYYQFDSSENFAHLNKTKKEFEVYQELGTVDGRGPTHEHGQFMPYNTLDTTKAHDDNPYNLYDIYGKSLPDSNPRKYETLYGYQEEQNYNFGMEIEGAFIMPPSGKDAWGHDIIFEFVGDDDFWLYVDKELVIDLGGKHSAVGAKINYSTGEAKINEKETSLYELFKANYENRNQGAPESEVQAFLDKYFHDKDGHKVFKDYTTHHIRIFYMERGRGASNLRMRFNLAAVTPGQVLLSKEVSGTDKHDYAGAKFPFQIFYREDNEEDFHPVTQELLSDRWKVIYTHSKKPVEFAPQATIGGVEYRNLFYLRPGETAAIKMPDNTLHYYIKECGVDTSIYSKAYVNNDEVTGEVPPGATDVKDYKTTESSVMDRAMVVFTNEVNPDALKTLTAKIRLFDETDQEISAEEDSAKFALRLYLSKKDGQYMYYKNGPYLVKNPEGYYCYYDSADQKFKSIGTKNYSDISEDDLVRTTFYTSPSGAASKLPAGYSVEIRDLLADTQFMITAEDYDNPVGYGKRVWTEDKTYNCYKRVNGSYYTEDNAENHGKIRKDKHAEMEVHFQKGYGIRAEKKWTDADFMRSHDDIYFAVYHVNADDSETLVDDTVRKIDAYNYTLYYFPSLAAGGKNNSLADYKVYEVELTGLQEDADGKITYNDITKIEPNGNITIGGVDKDGETVENLQYTVSYEQGAPENNGRRRTDKVTNTRLGGLKIEVEKPDEAKLAGAVFELRDSEDKLIGAYTSDADGLVTDAYLEEGTYTLKQTKSPTGYVGMQETVTIKVASDGKVTIDPETGDAYEYDEDKVVLTAINTPYTLKAVKVDASSQVPLEGAEFSLYREVQGSDGPMQDYDPMEGYTDLVSDAQGVISGDKVKETLKSGGYYLVETKAPASYEKTDDKVLIRISKIGEVGVDTGSGLTGRIDESQDSDALKTIHYTVYVPNGQEEIPAPTNVAHRYLPYILIMAAGVILAVIGAKRRKSEASEAEEAAEAED